MAILESFRQVKDRVIKASPLTSSTEPVLLDRQERTLFTNWQINRQIKRVAKEIVRDHKDHQENVVFMYLPEGANTFWVDLSRQLHKRGMNKFESYPVIIKSYSGQEGGDTNVLLPLPKEVNLTGRNVEIVDDIADRWKTLFEARKHAKERGAQDDLIEEVIMLDKPGGRLKKFKDKVPTYVALRVKGKPWVEGRGLDTDGKGRGNPNIIEVLDKKPKVSKIVFATKRIKAISDYLRNKPVAEFYGEQGEEEQ
jgi:hypoxanthine-guanine phosphoribosyltransferase